MMQLKESKAVITSATHCKFILLICINASSGLLEVLPIDPELFLKIP